jgi:hypothetical protein
MASAPHHRSGFELGRCQVETLNILVLAKVTKHTSFSILYLILD